MTIYELIQLLGRQPPDLRVVVNGYEDGYDDLSPEQLRVVKISLDTGEEEWVGKHGGCRLSVSREAGRPQSGRSLGLAAGIELRIMASMIERPCGGTEG